MYLLVQLGEWVTCVRGELILNYLIKNELNVQVGIVMKEIPIKQMVKGEKMITLVMGKVLDYPC
jgi:hypothetical protein